MEMRSDMNSKLTLCLRLRWWPLLLWWSTLLRATVQTLDRVLIV